MFGWIQRWRGKRHPLVGAPAVRRQKSYSASSGYVYQYYYEGHRPASGPEGGDEYVFEVSADRRAGFPVSVLVSREALSAWEAGHQRALRSNERYAIAKMALFQAFDDRDKPADMRQPVRVRPADVQAILETLGIES